MRTLYLSLLLPFLVLFCTAAAEEDQPTKPLDFSESRFETPPKADTAKRIVLMFTGDTKLHGRTLRQMAAHGIDYPFAKVADELRSADLAYANCETAITDHPTSTPGKSLEAVKAGKAFIFKSDPQTSGKVLTNAGIDVVQLANNHAMDYCAEGLLDTIAALDSAGIAYVGAGRHYTAARAPRIVEVDGVCVGLLAYSMIVPPQSAAKKDAPGINYLPVDYARVLKRDIAALQDEADLIMVGFHWGQEGSTTPGNAQRKIAHTAIDAGADLVIGTHTHTFQGIEHYKGGLIAYSLGNFVFTGKSKQLDGGILRVIVEQDGAELRIAQAAVLPCLIKDGVPTPSNGKKLRARLNAVLKVTGSRFGDADGYWRSVEP